MGSARHERARERAETAGQGHLFRHWRELDERERDELASQVERVDFALVARHAALARGELAAPPPASFEPPEVFPLARSAEQRSLAARARDAGARLLAEGKVGFLVVAGGQASRLGFEGPKGAFSIGPVSGASLFELHARRLLAARARHGARAVWYVMTSQANDAATREYFERHGHFGLDPRDVRFFSQAMVPALDFEGRILMSSRASLFLAPNGHGGSLAAFAASGALEDARARGIELLSYFQVDNPLARPADPLFLGLHALAGAGMSSKVVEKRDAAEKVGVLGRVDGVLGCIEYSDLPPELREARDVEGRLRFRAGNIAMHVLGLAFVERVARDSAALPWHVARKSMNVYEDGRIVSRQGAKFETFVFDALARSPASVTLEVERRCEFSPVKNASGEDSPASARRDLCRLHAGWIERAGLALPPPDAEGVPTVEVDPLFAEDEAEFLARARAAGQRLDAARWYR
jgi:UDP-N-acetylglucosamine/UDP-N-acetylgalactosamine diphosphorylase